MKREISSSIVAGLIIGAITYSLWKSGLTNSVSAINMMLCVAAYLGYDIVKHVIERLKKKKS